jgi:hypothetical protein
MNDDADLQPTPSRSYPPTTSAYPMPIATMPCPS